MSRQARPCHGPCGYGPGLQQVHRAAFPSKRTVLGQLALYASTVTREEIDRIPLEFRSSHAEEYEALSKVKASQTAWVEGNVDSPSFGNMAEHPDFQALRRILKDKDDARLLFQTKMASIPSFVTLDLKTIRNKSAAIANLIGVEVFTPSEYLASTLRSA